MSSRVRSFTDKDPELNRRLVQLEENVYQLTTEAGEAHKLAAVDQVRKSGTLVRVGQLARVTVAGEVLLADPSSKDAGRFLVIWNQSVGVVSVRSIERLVNDSTDPLSLRDGLHIFTTDGKDWYALDQGDPYFTSRKPGDKATALQAAINAAAKLTKRLRVIGTITLLAGVRVPSDFELDLGRARIDFSGAPNDTDCFYADGTEGAALSLTANAAKGASSITLSAPDAATLAFGDWIRVCSNTVFDASDTNSEIGELVLVKLVAGTVVSLETPLRGGPYNTASGATASKVTPAKDIYIHGGTVVGGGTLTSAGSDKDHRGVRIFLGHRCLVEQVRFERTDLVGVWLQDCTFSRVDRCHFKDFVNDNQAYGVLWDNACQDCTIGGCTGERIRHLVTMGNSSNTKGITRRITYEDLHVYSTTPARGGSGGDAIDTHSAAEDLTVANCFVYSSSGGGINIECASAQVRGCQVFNTTDYGIIYHNETDQEGEILIEGCRVINAGLGGTWEGIRVNMPTRGATAKNKSIRVLNNEVEDCTGIGVYVVNSVSAVKSKNLVIVGNTVKGAGSASASFYFEDCEGGTVSGNSACEPTNLSQQMFQFRDCKNLAVCGNSAKHAANSTGVGFYVNASGAGTCTGLVFDGNSVGGDTPVNLRAVVLDNGATNITVGKNNFVDCNTAFVRGTGTGHDIVDDLFSPTMVIASGAIVINRNWQDVVIDTEAAAAIDDLDVITGAVRGQIICLRSLNSGRDPTVRHVGGGTGNIILDGGVNFTLATSNSTMTLMWGGSFWREIGRCV